MLINLSDQSKGILLIVGGSALVLNYLGFIQLLEPIIAIVGLIMIVVGVIQARFHQKIYLLIKKDKSSTSSSQDIGRSHMGEHDPEKSDKQDDNEQPPQQF